MPKITVEFDLPDEKYEFHNFTQANKMYEFICEFQDLLRSWDKYGSPFPDNINEAISQIKSEWFRLKEQVGVVEDLE